MYKINILYSCYTLLLLGAISSAHARPIKIATWNMEWLISNHDAQRIPIPKNVILRDEVDFQSLSHYANKLNADIVALQEIGSIDTLKLIFPEKQYSYFISKDSIAQHTALVVRKNLFNEIEVHPDFSQLQLEDSYHPLRSGLDLTLVTEHHRLRLLIIHLKSGCQDYPLDHSSAKKNCILLNRQQALLKEWIHDRQAEKIAFIVLGDFNRVISPNDTYFKSLSESLELNFPTAYHVNPCWDGSYFIDGFILNSITAKWMIPNSLRVMCYDEQDYGKLSKLSDHCPVSIKLEFPQ